MRRAAVLATLAAVLSGGASSVTTPAKTSSPTGPEVRGNQNTLRTDARPQEVRGLNNATAALLGGYRGPAAWGGIPPKVWGMSRACANMVRKTRIRRSGHGGQKQ